MNEARQPPARSRLLLHEFANDDYELTDEFGKRKANRELEALRAF
jgi:hypothetical protein